MTRVMARLGAKHWADLPWDGALGRDERLRSLEATEIEEKSRLVLGDLDDLCVLLLFSVFEATVRERALADVSAALPSLSHPAVLQAVESLRDSIGHGSFSKVLEAYKRLDTGLVEEVNQVRRYRNWVAHGRRSEQPALVVPQVAYDRLRRFLDRGSVAGSP